MKCDVCSLASTVAMHTTTLAFLLCKYRAAQTLISADAGCSRQKHIMVGNTCFSVAPINQDRSQSGAGGAELIWQHRY